MDRIILAFRNSVGAKPRDAPSLRRMIASLAGARSVNVRVSPDIIEVDMIADKATLPRLEAVLGPRVALGDAGVEDLIRSQRFWEAHEVLEDLWRRSGDIVVKAVIQVMAALAKAQEGDPASALRILERIPESVEVNTTCIKEAIMNIYQGLRVDPLRCMGAEVWRRIVLGS